MKTQSKTRTAAQPWLAGMAAALAGALLAPGLAQATTVLNSAPSPASQCPGCLNFLDAATTIWAGQTFTAPTVDTLLDNFQFTVIGGSGTLGFVGEIYAWDGSTTTGSALYTSATQSYAAPTSTAYAFDTSLDLTAGAMYIAVLHVVSGSLGGANADMPLQGSGGDPNGAAYFHISTGNAWSAPGGDYSLVADFKAPNSASAAPEPAAWALMILGLGGAGGALRRRRAVAGVA